MQSRRQEKTEQTRCELKQAAHELFIERGFDATGIADIVARARYSVGSFYRHFKTKSDVLAELWLEYLNDYIRESAEKALTFSTLEQAFDYLIERSNRCMQVPLAICYTNSSISMKYVGPLPEQIYLYTEMLLQLLQRDYPNCDERRLTTSASILHTVLNAHAARRMGNKPQFVYDDEALKRALLLISQGCQD